MCLETGITSLIRSKARKQIVRGAVRFTVHRLKDEYHCLRCSTFETGVKRIGAVLSPNSVSGQWSDIEGEYLAYRVAVGTVMSPGPQQSCRNYVHNRKGMYNDKR